MFHAELKQVLPFGSPEKLVKGSIPCPELQEILGSRKVPPSPLHRNTVAMLLQSAPAVGSVRQELCSIKNPEYLFFNSIPVHRGVSAVGRMACHFWFSYGAVVSVSNKLTLFS